MELFTPFQKITRMKVVFSNYLGDYSYWELRNIYPNSGSIHPYGRYGNAGKTSKTISTIAILWPVKAILEKRAATVEVDTLISPVLPVRQFSPNAGVLILCCVFLQKTVPGRVRGNFAQNGGHEKATEKAQTLFF